MPDPIPVSGNYQMNYKPSGKPPTTGGKKQKKSGAAETTPDDNQEVDESSHSDRGREDGIGQNIDVEV